MPLENSLVWKFTAASHGSPCDSTALVKNRLIKQDEYSDGGSDQYLIQKLINVNYYYY